MQRIFFLFIFLLTSARGQREGESCVDDSTNTAGRCTVINQCESAKRNLNQVLPTFCSYNALGETVVCCRDDSNILNAGPTKEIDDKPIWGNAGDKNDRIRVSERKCEEYSRSIVRKIDYIPLLPNPESFSVSEANCKYTGVELIIGGENTKPGEFPHMAAIGWADFNDGNGYKFNCGGTLISSRFVVTAAHCCTDGAGSEPTIVRLGDQNIDDSVQDGADPVNVRIQRIHRHPGYHSPKVYNDIALIELEADVKFSISIRPACLWTKNDLGGQHVIATGWGVINQSTEQKSNELQKVLLSVLDVNFCNQTLKHYRNWRHGFIESQMCVGELRGGKDTCQGDSGGPIQVVSKDNVCLFYFVGVTSFGKNCAVINRPAVYTRISSYIDWIESVVWPGQV